MQETHLFEYAIIRLVPKVEREEFINIGVILYCSRQQFLQARYELDPAKLQAIAGQSDLAEIKENLEAICHICKGDAQSGTIGALSLPERFRWLTAIRSTIVQTSRVHPGLCANAGEMLERLFGEMVL